MLHASCPHSREGSARSPHMSTRDAASNLPGPSAATSAPPAPAPRDGAPARGVAAPRPPADPRRTHFPPAAGRRPVAPVPGEGARPATRCGMHHLSHARASPLQHSAVRRYGLPPPHTPKHRTRRPRAGRQAQPGVAPPAAQRARGRPPGPTLCGAHQSAPQRVSGNSGPHPSGPHCLPTTLPTQVAGPPWSGGATAPPAVPRAVPRLTLKTVAAAVWAGPGRRQSCAGVVPMWPQHAAAPLCAAQSPTLFARATTRSWGGRCSAVRRDRRRKTRDAAWDEASLTQNRAVYF